MIWPYVYVFLAALAVDLVPFFGPPAWIVMVFFQMRYHLDIWLVLVVGVIGSTIGRYTLSKYIPYLSDKIILPKKNDDIHYIGEKLGNAGWKVPAFVFLYTLMPLPSTPLFTASGMARINAIRILPAFFMGKLTSDMVMVMTGDYFAANATDVAHGMLSWKSITGSVLGVVIIALFLFIDWRRLLQDKQLRLNFHVWK